MPEPHHSIFYRPDALPAAKATVSNTEDNEMTSPLKELNQQQTGSADSRFILRAQNAKSKSRG